MSTNTLYIFETCQKYPFTTLFKRFHAKGPPVPQEILEDVIVMCGEPQQSRPTCVFCVFLRLTEDEADSLTSQPRPPIVGQQQLQATNRRLLKEQFSPATFKGDQGTGSASLVHRLSKKNIFVFRQYRLRSDPDECPQQQHHQPEGVPT